MVAPELKLTKKVTADKEGAGPPLPRIVVERIHVLSADIGAHGPTGGCPCCAALASHRRGMKPHNDECRERIRKIVERTLTGKAKECKRGKELGLSEVQRMCFWKPGKEEQLADRRAVASGEEDNQHEENRMRDTTVAKENRRQQVKNNLTN